MRTTQVLGAVTFFLLLAGPARAQQHMHQGEGMHAQDSTMSHMQMMHGGMMGMMMEAMPPGPGMILHAADDLELTPDQRTRLTALRDGMEQAHQEHMQAAMASHQAAGAVLDADEPDLDAYRTHLTAAAEHMVTMHVAMTRTALEARGLLTEAQQARLKEMAPEMMHRMHEGGMMGGDGHGPGHEGDASGGHRR